MQMQWGNTMRYCAVEDFTRIRAFSPFPFQLLQYTNFALIRLSLLEKGKQILMKDNLIDDERAREEEAAQETMEHKLERIGGTGQRGNCKIYSPICCCL